MCCGCDSNATLKADCRLEDKRQNACCLAEASKSQRHREAASRWTTKDLREVGGWADGVRGQAGPNKDQTMGGTRHEATQRASLPFNVWTDQ
jgi:hypothetical protein